MPRFLLSAAVIVMLAGCASTPEPLVVTEVKEVRVPYHVPREVPAWLAEPYSPEALPEFLAPAAEDVVVGLDEEGARLLRELIRTLKERDDAWREWAEHY